MVGTSLLWRSTVAFTYLKVKSTKFLCLLPAVLVLCAAVLMLVLAVVKVRGLGGGRLSPLLPFEPPAIV